MNVREAVLSDAKGIAKVHIDSWRTTYKGLVPDQFLDSLDYDAREERWQNIIPNGKVWVAENNQGEVVGFASGGPERSGDYPSYEGEIYAIYILKDYQGQGLGKMLVKPIVEHLKQQGIGTMLVLVLEGNPATHFYESVGGKAIGTENLTIAGKSLNEIVYAWDQLPEL
ncbi:GNAT family N-acetyltransferase [Aquisalibacillus elongatus]|uniref:L-amino acid N-acyltransferase YncA n=1 Tax=Aquisalibacillus elongatus TaxID=485577 RepID=A0A3N5BUF9_9BACI|nr:GNAT family N-acetyltransferase [Aquisalibacillus elongatus]RPF53408.1 L-amino acid N-acyltransferase YncA [Aquisalibacillus elongatus]